MNKKFLSVVCVVGLAASMMVGCGSSGSSEAAVASADTSISENATPEASLEVTTGPGYGFVVNGVTVEPEMIADAVIPSLGNPASSFEAPSCAGQGTAYTYNYGSFQIETYPAADGTNRIGFISLFDDTVATAEGIDMSMTKDDVIAAYGSDYVETDAGLSYVKGDTKINFYIGGDGYITNIEYVSSVIG